MESLPASLWRVLDNRIAEYYFIAGVKSPAENIEKNYAIYATKSGHFPERIYIPHIDTGSSDYFSEGKRLLPDLIRKQKTEWNMRSPCLNQ